MRNLKYIYIVILLTLFVGCVKYSDSDLVSVDYKSNTINLSIDPSSKYNVGTKSEEDKELLIHRGYLFVFSSDGTYKGNQKLSSGDIVGNGSSVLSITTTVTGYDSATDKIICVFNYCKSAFDTDEDFSGITKENISTYFPFSNTFISDLEKDLEDKSYTVGMPMFVNDFDDTNNNSLHEIHRALAKIELFVNPSKVSIDLTSHEHSFNSSNVEFAIVNEAVDGNIGFSSRSTIEGKTGGAPLENIDVNTLTFYQPSQPVDGSSPAVQGKVLYLYEFPYSTKVINGTTILQGVYSSDRLSIILKHEDNVAHPGETFYYKLQLVDKSSNNYYNIERNHDYRVVISNVHSDGYTSLHEAYDMPPSNIEYEVFDDKGDITLSNGQYAISMDEIVNYESVTIYGPNETKVSFSNIRSIFPASATEGLTQADLDNMTNSVEYALISKDPGLTILEQNDFATNPHLTTEGRSINLTIDGEGSCTIKLIIKLGNLTIGGEAIIIKKIGGETDLGGDSSFDAHPCQLTITDQELIPNTWNSEDSDFGARLNKNGETVIYMGENATPVGYRTMDGEITTALSVNAYPHFEPKTREGYYSYYDKKDSNKIKKTKIVLNQLAPFYVGHFGNLASGGNHYYNALIVEKIEEIEDDRVTPHLPIGGVMEWSEAGGKVYYRENPIYGEYGNSGMYRFLNCVEGLSITKYIVENNRDKGSLPTAAQYCYMKNDIDGDGVIESDEPIVWYLPAKNQMLSMWISRHLFESDPNSTVFGFTMDDDSNPYYWTSSEVDNVWDGNPPSSFTNYVTRVNVIEGEIDNSAQKGKGWPGTGFDAHVRCVRSIVYHQ